MESFSNKHITEIQLEKAVSSQNMKEGLKELQAVLIARRQPYVCWTVPTSYYYRVADNRALLYNTV